MARPLRLEFAGALYHITARGDRREDIYEGDEDRQEFLAILGEVCGQYHWVCHAYCLMTNHYHLLIETVEPTLSKGMRQLNGVYTQRFNAHHGRVGHVFQGRYKAILIDKQSYLMEVARYIVLNPVRAGMVSAAGDWPWSSYCATVGDVAPQDWLQVDWILAGFADRKRHAIAAYRKFVKAGKGQRLWDEVVDQVFLGDESFVCGMKALIADDQDLSEIPANQRRPNPLSLEQYQASSSSRDHAIVSAYASGAYSLKDIGEFFGLHYSRVSRIVSGAKGKT